MKISRMRHQLQNELQKKELKTNIAAQQLSFNEVKALIGIYKWLCNKMLQIPGLIYD